MPHATTTDPALADVRLTPAPHGCFAEHYYVEVGNAQTSRWASTKGWITREPGQVGWTGYRCTPGIPQPVTAQPEPLDVVVAEILGRKLNSDLTKSLGVVNSPA